MSVAKNSSVITVDDCWNRIGVRGNKKCPELNHCLHCRNCGVYSRAGRQLLDRKLPSGYLQAWTKLLSQPIAEPLPGKVSALVFRIGPEWFALATSLLVEVLETRAVHSIPDRSNPILLGLLNVRGEMQLCVSVGRLLGVDKESGAREAGETRAIARLLLVSMERQHLAFHVSEVQGIHHYHPDDLQPLPSTLPGEASIYSKGLISWQHRHVAVLDERLLFEQLNRSIQ